LPLESKRLKAARKSLKHLVHMITDEQQLEHKPNQLRQIGKYAKSEQNNAYNVMT